MHRMDLVRGIMLGIHSRPDANAGLLKMGGIDEAVVTRHLEMLLSEGLIEGDHGIMPTKVFLKEVTVIHQGQLGMVLSEGAANGWHMLPARYIP
jgi:hypothetical protein